MRRGVMIGALLMTLPALALAQRGGGMRGGGGMGGRGGAGRGEGVRVPEVSTKDLQKFDPVKVLLDKHKDLKLDDAQRKGLDSLDKQVTWNVKKLAERVDSTQKAIHDDAQAMGAEAGYGRGDGGGSGGDGGGGRRGGRGGYGGGGATTRDTTSRADRDARRQRVMAARDSIAAVLTELQQERAESAAKAFDRLNATQKPIAKEFIDKQDIEIHDKLHEVGYNVPMPNTVKGG